MNPVRFRTSLLVGGYTVRVLHDRMSPAERDAFDSHLDFAID